MGAQSPEEILKQAIGMHQSGDVDGAIVAYRKYLAVRPDSVLAASNLGAAYARLARYPEAAAQYRRALKLQPGNAPVKMNLGLTYYKTGQFNLAASIFEEVRRGAPDELQPILLLADCRLSLGENQKVVELLEPIAAKRPDDLAVAYLFGAALVRDNQVARGQPIIDRILRNGDSAEARLLLGTAKLNAKDYPAALTDLAKAVELNPNLPNVYTYYGQALLGAGDSAAASAAFHHALSADPYDYAANLLLAVLLKEDERFDEALGLLKRALQARPGGLLVRYQIAAIGLQKEEKLENVRAELESIVRDSPAFTEAHVALATVYYRLKRKTDGDRERAAVQRLNRDAQARQQQGIDVK